MSISLVVNFYMYLIKKRQSSHFKINRFKKVQNVRDFKTAFLFSIETQHTSTVLLLKLVCDF